MGLFDGRPRLPRIEALDLRPARPVEATSEPQPCVDCGRLTRAGELCCRCQIVDQVARSLGWSREDVWRAIVELRPPTLEFLLDEREFRQLAAAVGAEG